MPCENHAKSPFFIYVFKIKLNAISDSFHLLIKAKLNILPQGTLEHASCQFLYCCNKTSEGSNIIIIQSTWTGLILRFT